MPFDSAGNFLRLHNWEEDRQNEVNIMSDRQDTEDDNFADGLSQCFLRSGRIPMTGDLKMGYFQIKNLANGTATNDAVNKSQLDALNTTLQNLITTSISNTLASLYPVGSIYIGTQSTCPLASLISGSSWTKISGDKVLQSSSSSHAANTTIAAGLPNITGKTKSSYGVNNTTANSGALSATIYTGGSASGKQDGGSGSDGEPMQSSTISFNASSSNAIYGNSSTVQPPAYVVNVWRRTA